MSLFAIAAIAAQTSATSEQIEFGHAKWDKFPRLERVGRALPYEAMVEAAELMLKEKQCKLDGQSARRFDISIPYAVLLDGKGKAERVLVADLGCVPLQNMVGEVVYQLSDLGSFKSGSATPSRWYADKINLTLE